ncbi:hypothetical protein N7463_003831 [Penicillium fimorum]|uniref:Uncharacterized protein n=1 Tax=Penicillium fimorum TaxID=1882269 RepID=A0A9X0CA90_9EURO|nr:hypothetical protein N7463_003831 [Penicillium fimorum]
MPGKGINLKRAKAATPSEYLDNMNPKYLECFWDRGDWSEAHGDNKGTTHGAYTLMSMMTSTKIPEYLIQVVRLKKPWLSFTLPGSPNKDGSTNPPTSQEVIDALAIELRKIGK